MVKRYIKVSFQKEGVHMFPGADTNPKYATGDWDEDHLLQITVNEPSWTYQSGDDVSITVVVSSEITNGYRGSDSMSVEVRLHG